MILVSFFAISDEVNASTRGLQPRRHAQRQRVRRRDPDRPGQGGRAHWTASRPSPRSAGTAASTRKRSCRSRSSASIPTRSSRSCDELTLPADQLKAFRENKDACVIGRKLADGEEAPGRRPDAAQGGCLPRRPQPRWSGGSTTGPATATCGCASSASSTSTRRSSGSRRVPARGGRATRGPPATRG